MRKVILILSAAIFIVACKDKEPAEGPKNTDLHAQNLKGNVQVVEETPYKVDSSGKMGAMDTCCIYITEYNEAGYNLKGVTKNSAGVIKSQTSYTQYEGGQAKEMITMADGKKQNSFSIQIDKDGKYSGGQSFDSTGKMDSYYTDLKEDEYGSVTDGVQHKADSTVKASFHSEYVKGLFVGGSTTDSSGKVVNTTKLTLNDKGDVIASTTTNVTKDSTTTKVVTYKYDSYDEQGNWTQRTAFDEKGKATGIIKRTITYYKKD